MNRDDAQEAMDAYQDSDPLRTGRRMVLRWGKNVKKSVKRGTGGVPIPPIRRKGKKKTAVEPVLPSPPLPAKEDSNGATNVVGTTQDRTGHQQPRNKGGLDGGTTDTENPGSDCNDNGILDGTTGTSKLTSSATTPSLDTRSNQTEGSKAQPQQHPAIEIPVYAPAKHSATAIHVIPPSDSLRLQFITTVASFVAKDGSH